MEKEKKKKCILATIWESMTKTGGCCGPGDSCYDSPNEDTKKDACADKGKEECCN